ncbi:MAG: MFS transporter, partial [Planctomycetaceae bacterium]
MSARLPWTVRWRLSILWALQWGITGTILTYLPLYLTQSGLNADQQGQLMAVTAIGLWVAPLLVGQVADRWLATERYLALSHFVGGVTLSCLPYATRVFQETNSNFLVLMGLVGLYAVAYFPTVALASSLSFRHMSDPQSQFGKVRVWGTVGWMLAGLSLSCWLGQADVLSWLRDSIPAGENAWHRLAGFLDWLPTPTSSDCFRMAAILSFALSSFCVFL